MGLFSLAVHTGCSNCPGFGGNSIWVCNQNLKLCLLPGCRLLIGVVVFCRLAGIWSSEVNQALSDDVCLSVCSFIFCVCESGFSAWGWNHRRVTSAGVLYSAKLNKRKLHRAE